MRASVYQVIAYTRWLLWKVMTVRPPTGIPVAGATPYAEGAPLAEVTLEAEPTLGAEATLGPEPALDATSP